MKGPIKNFKANPECNPREAPNCPDNKGEVPSHWIKRGVPKDNPEERAMWDEWKTLRKLEQEMQVLNELQEEQARLEALEQKYINSRLLEIEDAFEAEDQEKGKTRNRTRTKSTVAPTELDEEEEKLTTTEEEPDTEPKIVDPKIAKVPTRPPATPQNSNDMPPPPVPAKKRRVDDVSPSCS